MNEAQVKSEKLAKEHWDWVVTWLALVYKDAFIHGFKHGIEYADQNQDKKA